MLKASRPTAVNLFWALQRMESLAEGAWLTDEDTRQLDWLLRDTDYSWRLEPDKGGEAVKAAS